MNAVDGANVKTPSVTCGLLALNLCPPNNDTRYQFVVVSCALYLAFATWFSRAVSFSPNITPGPPPWCEEEGQLIHCLFLLLHVWPTRADLTREVLSVSVAVLRQQQEWGYSPS